MPSVYGDLGSSWELPCMPFADKKIAVEHIPSVDFLVWIEFENGDPELPIWTGFFYL